MEGDFEMERGRKGGTEGLIDKGTEVREMEGSRYKFRV
jgi:hypothetical protein